LKSIANHGEHPVSTVHKGTEEKSPRYIEIVSASLDTVPVFQQEITTIRRIRACTIKKNFVRKLPNCIQI